MYALRCCFFSQPSNFLLLEQRLLNGNLFFALINTRLLDTICFTGCISLFWWKGFLYFCRDRPAWNASQFTHFIVSGDSVWFNFDKFVSKITSAFSRDGENATIGATSSFVRSTNWRFNSSYNSLCNFEIGPSRVPRETGLFGERSARTAPRKRDRSREWIRASRWVGR